MKNIKTSKVVALILSIAMILNVFAGLSLTSFAADDITVGMYFMDQKADYATPSTVTPGQEYTAVVYLRNYNATNAASYPISGLQVDVTADANTTIGVVNTFEKSGYQINGNTEFTSKKTGDNGETIVSFASVYGAPDATTGDFVYSTLASSDADIEICAFEFTVSETATGTITFPISVIAADSSLSQHSVVVNNGSVAVGAANTTEKLSLYGPDLEAINSAGTYNIDDATAADGTGYTPFGTSWTAAGFAEGSSLVRMGYNNFVYLGSYDFTNVTKIEITYHTDKDFVAANSLLDGATATLGLSKVAQSFGWAETTAPHFENAVAYGALSDGTTNGWPEARTVTITEGIDTTYNGDVWLTSYSCNGGIIVATDVTLYRSAETTDPEPDTVGFQTTVDNIFVDGVDVNTTGGIGGTEKFVWSNYNHLPELIAKESFSIAGWCTTTNGIEKYQYSVNNGEWKDASCTIYARTDLTENNYPYPNGHATAGFTDLTIPYAELTQDYDNTVDIRIVDLAGNEIELFQFTIDTAEPAFTAFHASVDIIVTDGTESSALGGTAIGAPYAYTETATISESFGFNGWCATEAGMAGYKYSIDGGATYADISNVTISSRTELVDHSVPYETGHSTAGYSFTIPASALEVGSNNVIIRGVDLAGNEFDLITATVVVEEVVTPTYTVSVGTVSNGTVTVSPSGTVDEGTTVTVTATAATGYELSEILVNGTAITGTTFTVTADSVVTATFTKIQYTVSVGTVSNGSLTLNPTGTVDYGTTVTVVATATTGYALSEILVNGTAIEGTTFTVTADSVVTATFTKIQYTVSVGTVSNGTVTLSATGAVDYGTTITVTATANEGYELSEILVNGTAITGTTFTVTADSEVTATFTETVVETEEYTITFTVGGRGQGTVSANGTTESRTYGQATAQTFTVKVAAGETVNVATASQPFVRSSKNYASICTLIESSDVTLSCSNVSKTGEYTGATFTMPESDVAITVNIRVFGDLNYDGNINVMDINAIKKHISSATVLTGEKLIVANAVGNYTGAKATVNVMDLNGVKAFIGKGTLLANGVYA
ncbi:MAG: dockerin type I repeat-containing protein [Clostridia bacterium]|nr:dockerin type I repeat-containing protein [Clostridia bacterium]